MTSWRIRRPRVSGLFLSVFILLVIVWIPPGRADDEITVLRAQWTQLHVDVSFVGNGTVGVSNNPNQNSSDSNNGAGESSIRTLNRLALTGVGPLWSSWNGVAGIRVPSGDRFRAVLENALEQPVLLHAHGLTPPSALDGTPFSSTWPLSPYGSVLNEFDVAGDTRGTFFLHSHVGFQHEQGLSVPLITEGPPPLAYPLYDELMRAADNVLFLEDLCGYLAHEPDAQNEPTCLNQTSILRVLRQRWQRAQPFNMTECRVPHPGMHAMHHTQYRYHLANGRRYTDRQAPALSLPAGGVTRLRVINSAAMSNYALQFPPQLRVTVVAVDGQWVVPWRLPAAGGDGAAGARFWLAVAQRADFLIEVDRSAGGDVFGGQPWRVFPVLALAESMMMHSPGAAPAAAAAGLVALNPTPTRYATRPVRSGPVIHLRSVGVVRVTAAAAVVVGGRESVLLDAAAVLAHIERTGAAPPDPPALAAALRASLVAAVVAAPTPGVISSAMPEQERQLSAFCPLPARPVDRWLDVNLTGENGFAGINGRGYAMPMPMATGPVPVTGRPRTRSGHHDPAGDHDEGDARDSGADKGGAAYERNPYPLLVRAGERVCLRFRNFDVDAHPMHLHGHAFQVVEYTGTTLAQGAVRDVVLVPAGGCQTVSVCFDADNPGIWPLHCHMSYHMAAGMFTTVEYSVMLDGATSGRRSDHRTLVPLQPLVRRHRTPVDPAPPAGGTYSLAAVLAAGVGAAAISALLSALLVCWCSASARPCRRAAPSQRWTALSELRSGVDSGEAEAIVVPSARTHTAIAVARAADGDGDDDGDDGDDGVGFAQHNVRLSTR